ncbi:nicotinate-nucleotide adenylyltransferase [Bacillus sp. T33-2]|uniref:nicotinate-nucleotide adenylyltransferase n=1 Tax=Bacillus sp. T33-2 TaxID=2054168 RepID=UPI000C75DC81|nr:nicotinate-nucleotide adenylyltransferase [Bacillus sp. T33-2]PLR93792.1 nicotinic acid mononucleotide adenylyltransferase [Bacillus sp. T33-2]
MKKIGILGGTFNPPHIGHLVIANEVLFSLRLDEIWFMPNQQPPHKHKTAGATNGDRYAMVNLAIQGHPCFRTEPVELKRSGPSYTYETMKILKEMYDDHEFFFIIGADMVEYLPKWYKIDQLIKMVTFVGVRRPDYSHVTDYPILNVDTPMLDISSSMIRKRLEQGTTIRYLVPEPVRMYIKENGLYGS